MPTGFLPNPVSTTRQPSGQTRWKKTSFALARLRPNSEYADGLLTESRLDNPTTIGSNPMGKISFALARLRPSSEYADGLLTESRLANLKAVVLNPMEENQSKIPKSPTYICYIRYMYSYNRYLYIIYINISMRFKQKKQSLGHIIAPLFLDL